MNNLGNDQAKQAAEPEFEFGIYTLGDIVTDCETGQRISPASGSMK